MAPPRCARPSPRSTGHRPTTSPAPTSCRRRSSAARPPTCSPPPAPAEAQALFKAGRCTRPVTFATNIVVMLVPANNPARLKSIYSLKTGPQRRLAVGTAGVPVGAYTRKLLARMRLSSILSRHIVSSEPNVASITSKVALGSADAGFAYLTDARRRGQPGEGHPPPHVGAAAGPLPAVRGPSQGRRHGRSAGVHQQGRVDQRPARPAEVGLRAPAARLTGARCLHRAARALPGARPRLPDDPDRGAVHGGAARRRARAAARPRGAGHAEGHGAHERDRQRRDPAVRHARVLLPGHPRVSAGGRW